MTRKTDPNADELSGGRPATVRAAEYVRMSTEHQQYSTENQADAIRQYAARRGFEIARTYGDAGKSGLNIGGRDGLKRLIDDVQRGNTDFAVVLVYDISRWGRFQDADESAYYEYLCKKAGIRVEYCAEQFENDGSMGSDIIKMMKRKMAGEYSRELSTKVFAGQCRLIELGFRQGGPAGYGLRRQMIDQNQQPKSILGRGERKSLQTDRVILIPGPDGEVETVRWMYRAFVEDGKSEAEVATQLNGKGIRTDLGHPWTRATVHQVLTNEKYIGTNVYSSVAIAEKTGLDVSYIHGILILLRAGEERLIAAVEKGWLPMTIATEIAKNDDADVQVALMEAYEGGLLRGDQFKKVRQLIDRRRFTGKGYGRWKEKVDKTMTPRRLLQTYQTEVRRQQVLVKKAEINDQRLLFVVTALRKLLADEHFRTLLRAEGVSDMPKVLADRLPPTESRP